jgi:hypothetical protein
VWRHIVTGQKIPHLHVTFEIKFTHFWRSIIDRVYTFWISIWARVAMLELLFLKKSIPNRTKRLLKSNFHMHSNTKLGNFVFEEGLQGKDWVRSNDAFQREIVAQVTFEQVDGKVYHFFIERLLLVALALTWRLLEDVNVDLKVVRVHRVDISEVDGPEW